MRCSNYYYGYLVDLTGDAYAIVFRIVYGIEQHRNCLLYTSPSPRDVEESGIAC